MGGQTTGTQKKIEPDHFVLQLHGELSESCLSARASFLALVGQLRPNVVTDLWAKVFPEFKQTVIHRFRSEIFNGTNLEHSEVEQKGNVADRPKARVDPLIQLLQQRLSLRGISPNESDLVVHEFFGIQQVRDKGYQLLVQRIDEWAKRWNLDADWCRDHALVVLREWLFTPELRWITAFPNRVPPLQSHGWRMATTGLEDDWVLSRVVVEHDIELDSPPLLQFRLRRERADLTFQTLWNTAENTESQFKQNARLDFRIWLTKAEVDRLTTLRSQMRSKPLGAKEFEKKLAGRNLADAGVNRSFEKALREYCRQMRTWKKATKAKNELKEVTSKYKTAHVVWLVLYQVPDADGVCFTHVEILTVAYYVIALQLMFAHIAHRDALNRDSVRNGVRTAAKLIGIKLRKPHQNASRGRNSVA